MYGVILCGDGFGGICKRVVRESAVSAARFCARGRNAGERWKREAGFWDIERRERAGIIGGGCFCFDTVEEAGVRRRCLLRWWWCWRSQLFWRLFGWCARRRGEVVWVS